MSESTGGPKPEWDAARGEWVSGAYRWDAPAGQWVLRETTPQQPYVPAAPQTDDVSAPQTPYATSPQAPYAAGPQAPYAASSQPLPGTVTPPPGKKLPTGALIGIIAGGLVVVLAVVLGIVFAIRAVGPGRSTAGPQEVVSDYFAALTAGDSKKALSYLDAKPADTTLLTDEALAASAAAGPIADVVVTASEASRTAYSVPVTVEYTIGGEQVSGQFEAVEFERDGSWKLGRGTIDIYVGDDFSGLNPTVNGVAIDSDTITVFPGVVELAIDNANYALTGTTTTIVSDPDDYSAEFDADVELSDAGLTTFRGAVNDAVTTCIGSKSLVAGCGIDLPDVLSDGTKIIDGTVTRTLPAETQATLANLEPEEIFGDPTQVRAPYLGGLDVTADCEVNGQRQTGCTFLFLPTLGSPLVDMTTEPPVVRWD